MGDDLKSAIKTFKPKTVQTAIDLGRDQSALVEALTKKIKGSGCTRNYSTNSGGQSFKDNNTAPQNVSSKTTDTKGADQETRTC